MRAVPETKVHNVEVIATTGDAALCKDLFGRRYLLAASEAPQGRRLDVGARLCVCVVGDGDPAMVSASRPEIVAAVLDGIIPEIRDGLVRVMGVARSPGVRTKVAVAATSEGVDPVRACVGPSAGRVRRLGTILGGERVDIVAWRSDKAAYAASALAPARVIAVDVTGDNATATVPSHQMAAAIGEGGLNSRLASELVGLRITAATP